MYVAFKILFCICYSILSNGKSYFGKYMTLKVFLKTFKVNTNNYNDRTQILEKEDNKLCVKKQYGKVTV